MNPPKRPPRLAQSPRRRGAVLHLYFEHGRPRWHLSSGADVELEVALSALDNSEIERLDDALPISGALPQSFVVKGGPK
jgi:hypothetical protein